MGDLGGGQNTDQYSAMLWLFERNEAKKCHPLFTDAKAVMKAEDEADQDAEEGEKTDRTSEEVPEEAEAEAEAEDKDAAANGKSKGAEASSSAAKIGHMTSTESETSADVEKTKSTLRRQEETASDTPPCQCRQLVVKMTQRAR